MASAFFDFLATNGLSDGRATKTLGRVKPASLRDLSLAAQQELPYVDRSAPSPFGFLASSTLSGGPIQCSEIECRIEKADELARFAGLYADQVLIRDPFARYSDDSDEEFLRANLASDIRVLEYLRPLIEEGLVGVARSSFLLTEQERAEMVRAEEQLRANLDIAADALVEQYGRELTFTYERTGFIAVQGPESLIPHGGQFLGPFSPKVALDNGVVRPELKLMLIRKLLNPILDDVFLQDYYKNEYQYRYLTDRELDIDIIDVVGGRQFKEFNRAILDGLRHVVPIVESVDVATLVSLRHEEGEAFRVYRDSVAKVLREADLSTEQSIREAFDDAIRPELNKINLAAANARKLQKRELARDIAVNGGIVAVGLLVGLLQPAVGTVAAALGGLKTARDVGGKLIDMATEPAKVRENGFYFLWRLQRAGEQNVAISVRP